MDRILVVEDERAMREIIRDYLTAHGLECDLARDGQEALELLEEQDYDAVVLDVLMPRLDGFGVCRAVRRQSSVPILFLTALGGEEETLRGYALGADDYVTKPFSLAVLLAKLQALIRRSRGERKAGVLSCGAIQVDTGARRCTATGQEVKLSPGSTSCSYAFCAIRGRCSPAPNFWTRCGGWTLRGTTGRWMYGCAVSAPLWARRASRSRRYSRRATDWRRDDHEAAQADFYRYALPVFAAVGGDDGDFMGTERTKAEG